MRKVVAKDITVNDLPKTRPQVFSDCVKQRFLLFFLMGGVCLLASLPLLAVSFLRDNALVSAYLKFERGAFSQEEFYGTIATNEVLFSFLKVPCFIVLGVVVSGVMRVVRRLVWGEPIFFGQDFFSGIKSNGVNYAIVCGVIALLYAAYNCVTPADGEYSFAFTVFGVVAVIVMLPIAFFTLGQTVIYSNGLFKLIKNSAIIYMRTVPTTILCVAVLIAPYFLSYIPSLVLKYVLLALSALVAPFILTAAFLYSCYAFDKCINKEHYPELYDRGVYR